MNEVHSPIEAKTSLTAVIVATAACLLASKCCTNLTTIFVFFSKASNKILGDFMVLAGAILYGCSNVGQEYAVRSFDCVEFLGMLGLFGSVVNGIQL